MGYYPYTLLFLLCVYRNPSNYTIGELLPDLPAARSGVTLRQLLNYTSELPDYTKSDDFKAAVQASPTTAPVPCKLLTFVENEPLQFPPGSKYEYSNSDNITVGVMIEAATGKSYGSQLQEQVLGPLDWVVPAMRHSGSAKKFPSNPLPTCPDVGSVMVYGTPRTCKAWTSGSNAGK